MTNGTLEPDPKSLADKKVTEPRDAGLGKVGAWTKTNDVLFPHEPSPNDIKQGMINDCFMLSALIKIAKDNPQKIKDAIRDNGDGTVSVRFYHNKERRDENKKLVVDKTPVDIRVNKTVKKAINGANIYSSSSLWVQMIEKAYAKFVDTLTPDMLDGTFYRGDEHGFQRLDRGNSSMFLNAFDENTTYSSAQEAFGFSSGSEFERKQYDLKAKKRNGYTENEADLFDFLGRTNDGEVITVGGKTNDKSRQSYMKNHGIRPGHAYTVMGTFEKEGKKYIQLRDPYATFEAKYNDKGQLVNNSSLVGNSLKAGSDTMGTFNLEFSDFMLMFNSIPGMTVETAKKFTDLQNVWYYRNKENEQKAKEAPQEKGAKQARQLKTSQRVSLMISKLSRMNKMLPKATM